jgi:hypothetical protein
MKRKELYNAKGYWKRRFKQTDTAVLQLLNFERSGAIDVPISDYVTIGYDCIALGLTGEEILSNMVKYGVSIHAIADMRNMINMVEVFSIRLKAIAESKWQGELNNFPQFRSSTATMGELKEKTKAIQEMNRLLEEN